MPAPRRSVPGSRPDAPPTVPDPDRLAWAARLRSGGWELDGVARALLRDLDCAGLAGPAGDALRELVHDVAGRVRAVATSCAEAADGLVADAHDALVVDGTGPR